MGKTALLLVMGLGMILGYLGITIRGTSEQLTKAQIAYLKYSYARNLARTAIHMTLRAYDRNLPSIPSSGNFDNGSYRVAVSENLDTLRIASTGIYADAEHVIRVTLLRLTKPFPTSSGAIGIRAKPVNFTLTGGAEVDGRNYDASGTTLVGEGDLPGVSTMTSADSANVVQIGGGNITGEPNVTVDTNTVDPLPYISEYKANADYLYNATGTYSGATWGTATNPVVVYCNAGDDTSFSIKFTGAITGYGILVVRGNVQFNGNFSFYGLVIVDGFNTQVNFSASGSPQVVGGLIVSGNTGASVALKGSGGSAKIKYSAQSLREAKNIGKLRYYSVLAWYE